MNILLPAHQRQPKVSERFLMYGKLLPRNWPPAVQQQAQELLEAPSTVVEHTIWPNNYDENGICS